MAFGARSTKQRFGAIKQQARRGPTPALDTGDMGPDLGPPPMTARQPGAMRKPKSFFGSSRRGGRY